MRGQCRKDYRYANKGKALEQLIEIANRQYRSRGVAIIEKVPTEWLPIRDERGRIVTAKVTRKAIVDFVGTYRGAAIAFDAKECSGHRIRWDRVEPHQAEFLDDWTSAGGIAFVLVGFTATHQHLVVPWSRWRAGWERSKHNGPASVSLAELEKVPEYIVKGTMRAALDYLEAVDRLWPERLRTERVG
jgi:recombination protein U